ncbi:MAG: hypothetical protein H8K07_01500 [Nitrospira sp.]|nr:hypothetical protein [Nitrospira sp.]
MTALERQVGDTFRAARTAAANSQWPSCARCFDGEDVRAGYTQLRWHPNVRKYYCAVCRYEFSDLTGSPLQGHDRPLLLWAFLLLNGDPRDIVWDRYGSEVNALKRAVATLAEASLGNAWREALGVAGLTTAKLIPPLKQWVQSRRARSRHGRKTAHSPEPPEAA